MLRSVVPSTDSRPSNRTAYVGMVALLCFALLAPFMSYGPLAAGGESNPLRQVVNLLTFGLALSASGAWRHPVRLLVLPWAISLALIWFAFSIGWAIEPGVALRRFALTAMVVWTVFLLCRELGYEATLNAVRQVLPIFLLLNYLAVLLLPDWSIHGPQEEDQSIVGAWHGILMNKNFAGPICALTVLCFLFDGQRLRLSLRLLVIAGSAYFLWRTQSKTSLGLLLMSIPAGALYQCYNPAYRAIALHALLIAGCIGALVLANEWDRLARMLAAPEALTGRSEIWHALLRYTADHWVLGSGFGSFWNIGNTAPVAQYTHGWVMKIASGHNGFLDLAVQVGLPGLLLAILATAVAPLFTFLGHHALPPRSAALLFACMVFCLAHNSTESSLFDRDAAVHVFLLLAIVLLRGPQRRVAPVQSARTFAGPPFKTT